MQRERDRRRKGWAEGMVCLIYGWKRDGWRVVTQQQIPKKEAGVSRRATRRTNTHYRSPKVMAQIYRSVPFLCNVQCSFSVLTLFNIFIMSFDSNVDIFKYF